MNLGFRLAGLFGFRFLGWGLHPCHHLQPVFRFRITNIRLFGKNFKAVGRGGNRCSSSCLVPTDSLGRFLFRFLPCLLLEGGFKQLWLHTRHLFDTKDLWYTKPALLSTWGLHIFNLCYFIVRLACWIFSRALLLHF